MRTTFFIDLILATFSCFNCLDDDLLEGYKDKTTVLNNVSWRMPMEGRSSNERIHKHIYRLMNTYNGVCLFLKKVIQVQTLDIDIDDTFILHCLKSCNNNFPHLSTTNTNLHSFYVK